MALINITHLIRLKIFLPLWSSLLILAGANCVSAEETSWKQKLYSQNIASIVAVLPQIGGNRQNAAEPEGTGVSVEGFILSANHVLGDANRVLVRDHLGNVSEAHIFLRDKATDLALLEPVSKFPDVRLSSEGANTKTGSDVCVVGNAFGLGLTLTCGIVSANEQRGIGFNFIEDFLQIDAAVNPGMSGAPLFNSNAELVGLVTSIYTKQSDGNLGVNFASSLRLINAFITDAKDREINRPRPGLAMQKAPLAGEVGRAGGLVKAVATASAEETAGIQIDDLIVMANDLQVKGQADYLAALVLAGENGDVKMQIIRDGKPITIQYSLGKKSEE